MTQEDMQQIVNTGVAWLDENMSDWRKQINLDTLSMEHYKLCIIGQLFGNYFDEEKIRGKTFMLEHGFTALNRNWITLELLWKKALKD